MLQINNNNHSINYIILYFIFLSLLLTPRLSIAQCGPSGNLVLHSQADIDNFIAQYGNCTEIKNNLVINGMDITNLDGLHQIKKINGFLFLYGLVSLTDITGLSSLDSIGGYLSLNDNDLLTNVDGFTSLRWVGGNLGIYGNDNLLNVDGLHALEKVGGILQIGQNPKLEYLDSLSNLKSIGKDLIIDNNNLLTDISGLRNIDPESISGNSGLYIAYNPKLEFCHLSNICTYLSYDPTNHPRTISNNAGHCTSQQTVVDACNNLPQCPLGEVNIGNEEDLRRFLIYYPNCTVINGNLILGSDKITNLTPLHNLITIKRALTINGTKITNLDGLSNITNIGYPLLIRKNPNLQNLNGLSKLTSLGYSLDIIENPSLINVDGLSGITYIPAGINIENNASLTNLNGFSNITKTLGPLTIVDNPSLINIEGIKNISPDKIHSVTIKNNPQLPVCNYENICSFLTTSKPREITGNAGSCADEAAVDQACTMSITHHTGQVPVTLYPNPVHDQLAILLDSDASEADFTILNSDAKEVYHEKQSILNKRAKISVSRLPAGVYFLHITLPDNRNGIMKFVKQ